MIDKLPPSTEATRLPVDAKIGAITLRVQDIDRAARFYTDKLGLTAIASATESVDLATAPDQPRLIRLREVGKPKSGRTTGLYHFALLVPTRADLANRLNRLVRSGYPLDGASDHLVSEALYLSDPDGNGIEIYRDRPRGEWTWVDGQVKMALDPLDLHGLLGEASDDAPERAPVGLHTGHIHLQVSDLQASLRYYRDVIGLDVTSHAVRGAAFLSAGGYHHHVGINTWAGTDRQANLDEPGLVDWELHVPDPAERQAIIEHQRQRREHEIVTDEGSTFVDPDGIGWFVRA